eukprot:2141898-Rhodomonas_salina.1
MQGEMLWPFGAGQQESFVTALAEHMGVATVGVDLLGIAISRADGADIEIRVEVVDAIGNLSVLATSLQDGVSSGGIGKVLVVGGMRVQLSMLAGPEVFSSFLTSSPVPMTSSVTTVAPTASTPRPSTDPCGDNMHNCDANAVCSNGFGSFTCSCKDLYTGDGVSCTSYFTGTASLTALLQRLFDLGPFRNVTAGRLKVLPENILVMSVQDIYANTSSRRLLAVEWQGWLVEYTIEGFSSPKSASLAALTLDQSSLQLLAALQSFPGFSDLTGMSTISQLPDCSAGLFFDQGQASCLECPVNTDSAAGSENITYCICNAGYDGNNGGGCMACSSGLYKSSRGSGDCVDCPSGSFSTSMGASTCTVCPAGTDSRPGSDSLEDCLWAELLYEQDAQSEENVVPEVCFESEITLDSCSVESLPLRGCSASNLDTGPHMLQDSTPGSVRFLGALQQERAASWTAIFTARSCPVPYKERWPAGASKMSIA